MDYTLTKEQEMIRDMVKEFAEKEIEPIAQEIDQKSIFPEKTIKKLGELGVLGLCVSTKYGGAGMDPISLVLVIEELSRVCASHGVIVSVNNSLVCYTLERFGSEEQKEEYLVPLASGKGLGFYALTEPGAGTDAASIQTTATLDGDEYVINGTKHFITNARYSRAGIVFATVDKTKRHKGICAFIVEKDTPGFKVVKEEDKMGIRAAAVSEIVFEDCRVPKENLLGGVGEGFKIALAALDSGRLGIAAQAVGIARRAMEESIKYSKERIAFGRPIADFQAIRWMIADMATRIEAARLLTLRGAYLKGKGVRFSKEAAMAKFYASDTAVRVTRDAVQIFGGYGYMKDYVVERLYRDAKITEIYEGTTEVQKMIISSQMLA
ncbi:MAG: acyl-CoA dehydrogenase [Methanobacteriota archaeon]|nr:MAG: acyl-CoA dehydrogenase [Euryarchaeota archaeon]